LAASARAQINAEHPVGWRNDGTGQFPGANPPTTWQRVSKAMEGLRSQAAKPGDGPSGVPMSDGVIRQWLGSNKSSNKRGRESLFVQ